MADPDNEFLEAVVAVYRREIATGKNKRQAHKTAELFRRNLMLSLAEASMNRALLNSIPDGD